MIAKLLGANAYYIVLRLFLFVAMENMKLNSLYDQGTDLSRACEVFFGGN